MNSIPKFEIIFEESEIKHTYLYYDMPLIYISMFEEKYYLNVFIDTSQEMIDRWLIAEISYDDLHKLNTLQVTLKALMIRLIQKNLMFLLHTNYENNVLKIAYFNDINSEFLPNDEFQIEYDYQNNKALFNEVNYTNNDLFISFSDRNDSHCIDSETFSEVLPAINSIYKSISNESESFNILSFPSGSFGVTLTSKNNSLFSTSIINNFVNYFLNLKNINEALIQFYFEEYGENILLQTKKMLKKLYSSELKFNFKDLTSKENLFTLTLNDYKNVNEKINTFLDSETSNNKETISINGVLTSINFKTGHFVLENANQNIFKGYFDKKLMKNTHSFVVPSEISATIDVIKNYDSIKEEIKTTYTIIDYKNDS